MRRALAVLFTLTIALLIAPATTASAQSCASPTVNALTAAEAAVSRPAINSPSEIPLSNVYSLVEQATFPEFTYAEAGPQYAGVFEALLPAGTPPPPRSVSAYPSEDIPDSHDADWGGNSHTEVTNISALATSSGSRPTDLGGGSAKSSRSWVFSVVECDVVTVVAGWEANSVTLAPGAFVEQMSQSITLVVGPDGSSADVETSVVGAEGVNVPSEGRPADPFADPIRENGGPTLDAGEPRSEVGDNYAMARGGGFNFLFADPESGQGAGYSIGGVVASIDVLGPLVAVTPPTSAAVPTRESLPEPPPRVPTDVGTTSAVSGTPPPPPAAAVQAVEAIEAGTITDDLVSLVTAQRRNWVPLFGLVSLVAVGAGMIGAIQVGRDDYATLDWIAVKASAAAARFTAMYLRW